MLLQSYIRTLGAAFASPRTDVQARMFTKQLAKELGHLIECVKLVNVDCFKAMIEGAMDPALAATVKLDQAFYENLTVGLPGSNPWGCSFFFGGYEGGTRGWVPIASSGSLTNTNLTTGEHKAATV